MQERNLVFDFKTGLYSDFTHTDSSEFTRKDLAWVNCGMCCSEDAQGKYFYEGVKIVAGKVQFKKVYYIEDKNGSHGAIIRLN